MVLILILLTFLVFFVMWLGDFYITVKTVKKAGSRIEVNPILRLIFRTRGKHIYIFKVVELGLFLYLIYFLANFTNAIPFYTLLGYILIYSLLVANNSGIYYKVTGTESLAFKYVFLASAVIIVLFIYLNFLIFTDLTISYKGLRECHSNYINLYSVCAEKNQTGNISTPPEITQILKSLNLSLPGGFGG